MENSRRASPVACSTIRPLIINIGLALTTSRQADYWVLDNQSR